MKSYKHIGWDFDDTLIGHDASAAMWDFIIQNPFDQVHHIVTFRSGGLERTMFHELQEHGSTLVRSHFGLVVNMMHHMWQEFNEVRYILDDLSDHPYTNWKGMVCHTRGFDVLIDDDTHKVMHGCNRYNIPHIHPDMFL